MRKDNIKHRFLADRKDKKIVAYGIDEENRVIGQNVDLVWLFKHRDTIKTGFKTRKEAERWLNEIHK